MTADADHGAGPKRARPRRSTRRDRPPCGARTRSGGRCAKQAGWGTPDHARTGPCRLHGGATRTHRTAAARAAVRQAVDDYGLPDDIPADIALLDEVARTAGHVQALAAMVADLPREELAWWVAEQTTRDGRVVDVRERAGPNAIIGMYRDERRHLVDVCRTVVALAVEERREQRAQRQADQFAAVVRELLAALALTPDQQARVPGATRAAVAALLAQPGVTEQPENRPGLGRGRP